MRVSGDVHLHAPVQQVWKALNDPAVLVRTLPGCEQLRVVGPDSYAMTVTAGVASIKGSYAAQVKLSDQIEPSSFVLTASGSGAPGTVGTTVQVNLRDAGDGVTELSYDADAVVGGMIGGVGQRMLVAVAQRMAGQFFAAVDDVLTGRAPEVVPEPVAAAEAGAPAGVFARNRAADYSTGFRQGMVFGAGVALVGVVVGAVVSRARRR